MTTFHVLYDSADHRPPTDIEELEAEHTFEPEDVAADYYAAFGAGFDQ